MEISEEDMEVRKKESLYIEAKKLD